MRARSWVMNSTAKPSGAAARGSARGSPARTITSSAVVGSSRITSARLERQRERDAHALPHAARELVRRRRRPARLGMPTMLEQVPRPGAARRAPAPARGPRSVSAICSPIVSTGLSASIALWNTMDDALPAQRPQRRPRRARAGRAPSKRTCAAGDDGGRRQDAQQRLGRGWTCRCPTRRRCRGSRPGATSKRHAVHGAHRPAVRHVVDAQARGRRAAAQPWSATTGVERVGLRPRRAGSARQARSQLQPRVGDLVEAGVEQREREADERHAQPGGREGPPRARQQRRVVLRPVEVRAPRDRARRRRARGTRGRPARRSRRSCCR